jgi:hypothetical protein
VTLDVDGNGVADALSDGIVIVRYLFGFTGNALISGVVDPNGSRNTAPLVEAYLGQAGPVMLDVDGNRVADALSDGIVIIRYLFGFTGDALINGVVDPAGTRNTAAAVETFLNGFNPALITASTSGAEDDSLVNSQLSVADNATVTSDQSVLASSGTVPSTSTSASTSNSTSPVVISDTEEPQMDLSLAYVQRSWVQDFVVDGGGMVEDDEEEDLLIALPG